MTEQQQQQQHDQPASTMVYYFGYGPMVHPSVRYRRGVNVAEEQPAILPEYRLTFAYGGAASVVPQRGYDVHGILMRCASQDDWNKMQQFETGYYATTVDVLPYDSDVPIRAYAFVMHEFDESKLDLPIEKLPQERYLRLLADGMRKYGLDEDYIQDQIMAVPFVPKRKPADYLRFEPICPEFVPPKVTFEQYQNLCAKETCFLFFVVGKRIIYVEHHDPQHPAIMWVQKVGHGHDDISFITQQTIVDIDMEYCETPEDVTDATIAWAENFMVDFMIQCGMRTFWVMELADSYDSNAVDELLTLLRRRPPALSDSQISPSPSTAASTVDSQGVKVVVASPELDDDDNKEEEEIMQEKSSKMPESHCKNSSPNGIRKLVKSFRRMAQKKH